MKDNPYQTPESDLATNVVQMPKTIWWKVFFFFMVIFSMLAIAGIAMMEEMTISIFEVVDLAISLIGMVGLFGLAFNRAIGKQIFWKYFFYVNALSGIILSIIFPLAGIELYGVAQGSGFEFAPGVAIGAIFIWASYLYGFKRPQIWNRA